MGVIAAASSIELRTLNERVLTVWLLIRLECEINCYCYSWIFLEEIITPKVETVVLIGVPCTNGKVNRLLEFPKASGRGPDLNRYQFRLHGGLLTS